MGIDSDIDAGVGGHCQHGPVHSVKTNVPDLLRRMALAAGDLQVDGEKEDFV